MYARHDLREAIGCRRYGNFVGVAGEEADSPVSTFAPLVTVANDRVIKQRRKCARSMRKTAMLEFRFVCAALCLGTLAGCHSAHPGLHVFSKSAPTDVRPRVGCLADDAKFSPPCGPSMEYFGYKPTCWGIWPSSVEQWRDSHCGPPVSECEEVLILDDRTNRIQFDSNHCPCRCTCGRHRAGSRPATTATKPHRSSRVAVTAIQVPAERQSSDLANQIRYLPPPDVATPPPASAEPEIMPISWTTDELPPVPAEPVRRFLPVKETAPPETDTKTDLSPSDRGDAIRPRFEPSVIALGCLGALCLGGLSWFRRRRSEETRLLRTVWDDTRPRHEADERCAACRATSRKPRRAMQRRV